MIISDVNPGATPMEAPAAVAAGRRRLTIGLPACNHPCERRFPMTPEGVKRLIERGFVVKMQQEGAQALHYNDLRYQRQGVILTGRAATLDCDIVIHPAPLSSHDAEALRRGALLLTLHHPELHDASTVTPLLRRHVTTIALDLIEDAMGNRPYRDVLAEIDGRAATTLAAGMLADPVRGKGILLGGVAGIVPCEVTILGSGLAARAAARAAGGLGATVRLFDDDVYSLRRAVRELGQQVVASSIHPHVLENALRSADVVIAAPGRTPVSVDAQLVEIMKAGAVIIDLSPRPGHGFPSLPVVDIADDARISQARISRRHICLINPGIAVARTAAMALSDTLLSTLRRIMDYATLNDALSAMPGLRRGVVTFLGRVVNPEIAKAAGVRQVDINIYLSLS